MTKDGQGNDSASALPRELAFVVQLAGNAEPAAGELHGRAVHIQTGEASSFDTVEQLFRFFAIRAGKGGNAGG